MITHTTDHTFLSPADSGKGTGDQEAASSSQETHGRGRLPAVLGMRDLTVFFLLIVLYLPNITSAQSDGPAVFIYWPLALLTFLLPSMYVTQWLARRFPGQGAPYFWAVRMLGPRFSFLAAFCAWWPGVLTAIITIQNGIFSLQYLVPLWFTTPAEQGLVILAVLLVATALACLPLRWLKPILCGTVGLYLLIYIILGLAGGWWLLSGHRAAVVLNSVSHWQPNGGSFAAFGLILLGFVGVDVPLFLGGEIRGGKAGTKRARHYVWWGGALAFSAYVIGSFSIMVIVPPAQAGNFSASMQAIQMVFGSTAGAGAAIVFATIQVAVTVMFLLAYSRLLFVVAQDHRLPKALTRVNRSGVPVSSIVVQAVIVVSITLLVFFIAPNILNNVLSTTDIPLVDYDVLVAVIVVVWECSTVLLFLSAIGVFYRQKRRIRHIAKQKKLLFSLSLVGVCTTLIGIWATLSSSWAPSLIPNDDWPVIVGGIALFSLIIGWVISEVPRLRSLLSEQHQITKDEIGLRTELERLYREQAQAAVTDPITGLPNHRAVMSRIEEEVSRCQRTLRSCAVLFVDLDHFKHVNDTCGHQAGDAILRQVGSRIRSTLRLEDFVGRYGGEEFTVTLTNTDLHEACQAAERLRIAVASQPCDWQADESQPPLPIAVTASIGVALYQLHGVTREALVEAADGAMYQAKHSGRNRICIADAEGVSAQEVLTAAIGEQTRERVVVQALTAAASAHDRGTSAHAQRMMRQAEATARMLGRPEEERHLIRLAALLHDIGKIGIPESILHKPGPLTEDEWAIMRRHPDIGCLILEQMGGIFQCLSQIIVAHHERWDGAGYPNKLAKEEIPLSARILTVVDSYDAMTSHRPYREALSALEARRELQRCSGLQYDPQVVEAFLRVLDEEQRGGEEVIPTGTTHENPALEPKAAEKTEIVQ